MVIQRVTNKNIIECNKCSWETVKPGERYLIRFFSNIPSLQSKNIEELLDRSIYMNKEKEVLYNYDSLIRINETLIEYVPKDGVFPSKIDYCWCYNCKSIEPIFLGKPFEYEPKHFIGELKLISSDNLYIPEEREMHSHIGEYSFDELKKEQIEAVKKIQELEKAKEKTILSSIFFRFSYKHNDLFALRRFLNNATEVLNKCEKKNKDGKDYYKKNKSKPRCLKCNSNDVSNKNYLKEYHYKCGGSIKEGIRQVTFRGRDKKPFHNIKIEYDKSGKLLKGILTGSRFVVDESDRLKFNNQSTGFKIDELLNLSWEYNDEIIKNYQNLQDYTDLNPLLQTQTNRKKPPSEIKFEESLDSLLNNPTEKETKGLAFHAAKEIENDLNTLTPREADVIRLYWGIGKNHAMTLDEIGEIFDLTRERVKQILNMASSRLNVTSRNRIIKAYLAYTTGAGKDELQEMFKEISLDKDGKISFDKEVIDKASEYFIKGEAIFEEIIQESLENEELRELKKEIGDKAYREHLKKEMYNTLKNKEIKSNDDTSDNNNKNKNDIYNDFMHKFAKGSRNKRLYDFSSNLIDIAKKGETFDLNNLIEDEINDISSYPTDLLKIYDNNPDNVLGVQNGYLLFIKIDIDYLAKFLNKNDNNRFDGFDDIEQYHSIFTAVYNHLAIKLGHPPLPTQ